MPTTNDNRPEPSATLPLHETSQTNVIPNSTSKNDPDSTSRKRSYNGLIAAKTESPADKKRSSADEWLRPKQPRHDLRRVSRFVEGSMKDRASKEPPTEFVETTEDHSQKFVRTDSSKTTTSSTDENGVKRSSGFFRLGKSVATAFSSVFSWKADPTQNETQKEEIWKAYQELKRKENDSKSDSSLNVMTPNPASTQTSLEESDSKRSSKSSWTTEQTQESVGRRSADLAESKTPSHSIRNSLLHFKKPSISNLRKAKSDMHLRTPKPKDIPPVPDLPPSEESKPPQGTDQRVIRKKASRKDLHRQQKLTKKVSDLESKLEQARRELLEVTSGDVPPVPRISHRTPHTPKLPSLPSERLLPTVQSGPDILSENEPFEADLLLPEITESIESHSTGPSLNFSTESGESRKRKSSPTPPSSPESEPATPVEVPLNGQAPRARKSNATSRLVTKGKLPLYSPPPANRAPLFPPPHRQSSSRPHSYEHENEPSKRKPSKIPRRSVSPVEPGFPADPATATASILGMHSSARLSAPDLRLDNHRFSVVPDGQDVPPLPRIPEGVERLMALGVKTGSGMKGWGSESEIEDEAQLSAIGGSAKRGNAGAQPMDVDREEWQWDDDIF